MRRGNSPKENQRTDSDKLSSRNADHSDKKTLATANVEESFSAEGSQER